MHKFSTYFAVIFLLLALTLLFSVIYFNMPLLLGGNKIVIFTFINTVMLVGVGVFFMLFKERIFMYLQNYRREKQL